MSVSFQEACADSVTLESPRLSSGQLTEGQANSEIDVAVHPGLPGRIRHEVAASFALVQGQASNMNLFTFHRAAQQYRIGSDSPDQIQAAQTVGLLDLVFRNPSVVFAQKCAA